jgi:hypothetical protein
MCTCLDEPYVMECSGVTVTTDYRNILTKKMEYLQVVNSVHVTKSTTLDLSKCN